LKNRLCDEQFTEGYAKWLCPVMSPGC